MLQWRWEAVTAIGTWALAVGTVLMVWLQLKFMRRSLSADVFARLTEKWDSTSMRKRRKHLAQALLTKRPEEVESRLVEDVINFFEDLGTMLRNKYLETETIWHAFSTSIRLYWAGCGEKYVTDMRDRFSDPTFYTEFEFLAKKMDSKEARKRRKKLSEVKLSTRAVTVYLNEESRLEE